ncbi:uridine kinase family protein [Aestuariimicrobium kwangyangense]|uniref:uridine kinase family protein n=1 Tax=Aestuariimicrobium kwangyangense TaxID=396389 RepID=UPI00041F7401|nr:uridine kinase [Aestuariimicrobium kwangyangense]
MSDQRCVFLVAGPSGSGKSRLAAQLGLPQLRLDDFYHDDTHPGMPRMFDEHGGAGIIDWDHPDSWDCDAAVRALHQVLTTGRATLPRYEISQNRAVGTQEFDLGDSSGVICEGVFAPQLLAPLRSAGVRFDAIWLDRPRVFNFSRRLRRDLAEHRKPPRVLVRRGLALMRHERGLRRRALAQGFRPLGMRAALAHIADTLTA